MSLDTATSPYLLAAKDAPVNWRAWSPDALAEARASDKPILLTIGYDACHWCHVLDQDSFRNAETAALINDKFVPVLVDREERPDLDLIYQGAAGAMRHQGGWPLVIFLTPDGVPFWVTGFLPREPKGGQPGFHDTLVATAHLWENDKVKVAEISATVRSSLEQLYNRDMAAPQETMNLDLAALRIAQNYDIFFGGMLGNLKFPNVAMLQLMWNAFLRTGTPQFSQIIFTTIDSVLFGGLFDHVGGGFFRHTQDERWMEPTFEKTLYDNAMLIEFCTQIWQFNRNELCRQRVIETVAFLLRDMKLGNGFAANIGSGNEDRDSQYYTWSEAEIDAALVGTFSARFKQVYGVTRDGNFRGRNLPRRLGNVAPANEADEVLLAKQRDMLLAARLKRQMPTRDERLLADWNGLAIAALARAGMAFDQADWVQAAIAAFDYVARQLGDGERLFHSQVGAAKTVGGFADDYANMARAAIQLWEVTGQERFLSAAKNWVRVMDAHFWNPQLGGYCFTADDAEPLFIRPRMLFENPAPAANGVMVTVLTRLAMITGDTDYMSRASTQAVTFGSEANRVVNGSGAFLTGFEYLANCLIILVIGHKGNGRTQDLVRAVWSKPLPNGMVVQIEPGDALPAGHPAAGKGMLNGQPTAYIVQVGNVSEGITDPAVLAYALTLPVQMRQQMQPQQPMRA